MRALLFVPFLLGLASCASAPAGFSLDVQLTGVRLSAVESVRLVIAPTGSTTMPRFSPPTLGSYEDGGVLLSVDDDGQLVLLVTGAYFRENAVPTGEGDLDPRLSLELWSDDTMRRDGPTIRGAVVAGGFEVASGSAFLPEWPLPLGDRFTFTMPCTPGREAMCRPSGP
jgi:hypothetical protein